MQRIKDTPTIGMFEVPLDENAVILRVRFLMESINGKCPGGNQVEDVTVTTTTGDSGTYSVTDGLKAGEAVIIVRGQRGCKYYRTA